MHFPCSYVVSVQGRKNRDFPPSKVTNPVTAAEAESEEREYWPDKAAHAHYNGNSYHVTMRSGGLNTFQYYHIFTLRGVPLDSA